MKKILQYPKYSCFSLPENVRHFLSSSYHYRFTFWLAGLPVLHVDLPDTTSLSCSEPAAAPNGSRSRLHQMQH